MTKPMNALVRAVGVMLPLLFVAAILPMSGPETAVAQDISYAGSWKIIKVKGTPRKDAAFYLAGAADFRGYTIKETLSWASDFVFSPSRAGGREVMHVYQADKVSSNFVYSFREKFKEKGFKFAVVGKFGDAAGFNLKAAPIYFNEPFIGWWSDEAAVGKANGVIDHVARAAFVKLGMGKSFTTAYFATNKLVGSIEPERVRYITNKGAWPPTEDIE